MMHFLFIKIVFPTNSENHNTKEGFCFLNQGTRTKFFLAVKVTNDFNMIWISFLWKQLCFCCLDVRFFSLILTGVSFYNSSHLYVFFFLRIDKLTIVLQLVNLILNLYIIENYIAFSFIIQNTSSFIVLFISFSFLSLTSISRWKLLKTCTILGPSIRNRLGFSEGDGQQKIMNGTIMFMWIRLI